MALTILLVIVLVDHFIEETSNDRVIQITRERYPGLSVECARAWAAGYSVGREAEDCTSGV